MTAEREAAQECATAIGLAASKKLPEQYGYVFVVYEVDDKGDMHIGVQGRGDKKHAALAAGAAKEILASGVASKIEVVMEGKVKL